MGFGPFLTVYLTTEKWTTADIGLVFTVGSVVAIALWLFLLHLVLLVGWLLTQALDERLSRSANSGGR